MHSGERKVGFFELEQKRHRRLVLALVKQARGGIAMPAIWVFERGNQLCDRCLAQPWQSWLLKTVRHDAVNPPPIIAAVQVQEFFDVVRQRPWMLDYLAVHI